MRALLYIICTATFCSALILLFWLENIIQGLWRYIIYIKYTFICWKYYVFIRGENLNIDKSVGDEIEEKGYFYNWLLCVQEEVTHFM